MNPYKAEQAEKKAAALKARCQVLLDRGDRVAAVKLYRAEARCTLAAAMQALGLKS